tara:strand:+ start:206 stop:2494 length:2289 start_codon:yes stop_codon:yes gene_type:complete
MFQGGGLSPLEQPRGILASSQSLVDQVAQNAINPNPTMTMNQGGTARFQQGGGFGATSDIPRRISLGTNEELLRRLVPSSEGAFGVEGRGRFYPPGITWPTARSKYQWSGEDISSPDYPDKGFVKLPAEDRSGHSRLQKGLGHLKDFLTQSYNLPLRAPYLGMKQWLMSGKSTENEKTGFFNVADDFPTTTPPQLATIQALMDINEGREVEILTAAKKVITEGGSEETGIALKEQINDVLNMTPPPPANVPMIGLLSEEIASQPAYGRLKEDVDVLEQEGDGKLRGYSNPDMPSPKRKTDVIDYGSLEGEVQEQEGEVDDVIDLGPIDVTGKQDDDKQDDDNPLDKFIDQQGGDQQGEVEGEGPSLVDQVKDAANTNDTEKATKTLKEYRDEFTKNMPEYQGMSKDEKAYSWIKMGMAIAAGESPNAITNISRGVLATIDEFADDPKKKREYAMQIALSGSKYALENVNKDREILRAFEEKERELVFLFNPKTNQQKTITKADLRAGKVPAGFMVSQDPVGDSIKNMNAQRDLIVAQAALLDAKAPDEINDKWEKLGTSYQDAALQVIDSVQSKTLLGPAIEMLWDPDTDLTGVKSGIQTVWNRITNAVGITDNDLPGKPEGEDNDEYIARVQGVIAKKITAILGESNRTISTSDRDRADELAGVFANYWVDKTLTDPDVLKIKIRNLWVTLDNDERQGRATMNRIVRDVGDLAVPGGKAGSFAESLKLTQQELFTGQPVISEKGDEVVDYLDMFDLEGNLL